MILRALFIAALSIVGFSCGNQPCVPGRAWLIAGGVQSVNRAVEAIIFNVERGACAPGQVSPPTARLVSDDGSSSLAVLEFGDFGEFAQGRVIVATPKVGVWSLELNFSGALRTLDIEFIEPLPFRTDLVIPEKCHSPFVFNPAMVQCTALVDAANEVRRVVEVADGETRALGMGTQLWRVSGRSFVTSPEGIGELSNGDTILAWKPSLALDGTAKALAVNSEFVFALLESKLVVFDRSLASKLDEIPLAGPIGRSPRIVASESQVVVLSNYDADGYGKEVFALFEDQWVATGNRSASNEVAVAVSGGTLWSCTFDGRLRYYDSQRGSGLELIHEERVIGNCFSDGFGYSDIPGVLVGSGQRYLRCPVFGDGGFLFNSVDLGGMDFGGCYGSYVFAHPDTTGHETVLFDFSK